MRYNKLLKFTHCVRWGNKQLAGASVYCPFSKALRANMADTRPLDDEWKGFIKAYLDWVNGWISPGSEHKFTSIDEKLNLLQIIVDSGEIAKEETVKLQCLGTYFGQCIVDDTGWNWVILTDEYGTDLAIKIPEKEAWIFPCTLISKRIEDGETLNVVDLYKKIVPTALGVNAAKSSS